MFHILGKSKLYVAAVPGKKYSDRIWSFNNGLPLRIMLIINILTNITNIDQIVTFVA